MQNKARTQKSASRNRSTKSESKPQVEDYWSRILVPGIFNPDTRRDRQLLARVLPNEFPDSMLSRLYGALEVIAISYGIDRESPHWLGETLFNLALEHPFLPIVERGRGRQKRHPKQVAEERQFVRFAYEQKARFEQVQGRKLSLSDVAQKLYWLHSHTKDPQTGRSPFFPTGEPGDPLRSLYGRLLRYKSLHPDLVPGK